MALLFGEIMFWSFLEFVRSDVRGRSGSDGPPCLMTGRDKDELRDP